MLQGRYDEALSSLARLRSRTAEAANTDPVIQIELMEMRVEATLIQSTSDDVETKDGWRKEMRGWKRLFEFKYRDRTMVGVLMMVFQRGVALSFLSVLG